MEKRRKFHLTSSRHDDDGDAFLPDPSRHPRGGRLWARSDAEEFAEEYLASATSAEFAFEDARDELSQDELGGPFLGMGAFDRLRPDYAPPGDEANIEDLYTVH